MKRVEKFWRIILIVFLVCMFLSWAFTFIIMGLLFLYVGVSTFKMNKKLETHGIFCNGTIVEYRSDGEGLKRPQISFTTLKGEKILSSPSFYVSSIFSSFRKSEDKVEECVEIMYDIDQPTSFMIKGNERFTSLFSAVFTLAGMAFVVAGFFY